MLWIAEVGSAHKGVPSLAYEYIRAFSEAGANVLKFQFGWTKEAQEAQGLEYNPVRYVDEWAADLRDWCNYFDVEIMASIWSMDGLRTAQDIQMRKYKIGARMKNKALIDDLMEGGINEQSARMQAERSIPEDYRAALGEHGIDSNIILRMQLETGVHQFFKFGFRKFISITAQ